MACNQQKYINKVCLPTPATHIQRHQKEYLYFSAIPKNN